MPDAPPPPRAENARRGRRPSVRFGGRWFARPVLCLVTTGASAARANADDEGATDIVEVAARASAAGIDIIQIREPRLPERALLTATRRVLGAVDRSRTAVLVNDRSDIALAAGADGVHLRADGVGAARVRGLAPAGFLIGRSVHSVEEARAAEAERATDYLIFGTVFPSGSKSADHPIAGVDALRHVCSAVSLPVLAIGGITDHRAAEAVEAGAAGIAAIGLFADAARGDARALGELVQRLRHAFDTRPDVV